jgi:6-phosphofructokinase 1
VVHHGAGALPLGGARWASAGGCSYGDEGCPAEAAFPNTADDNDDGEGLPPARFASWPSSSHDTTTATSATAPPPPAAAAVVSDDDAGDPATGAMPASSLPALPASWAVRGGPRDTIYFHPPDTRAAIVTVGGLCPGLNDIIRALVQTLETMGVREGNILGIRYGFRGFYAPEFPPLVLNAEKVDSIHLSGGTLLGTSRGGSDVGRIVDAIAHMRLDMVYVVGGNGGNAAVDAINAACRARDLRCAVVGLPKSIDNDILLIDSCFGFNTAVGEAVRAIAAANVEARSMHHGVGLVKLMGRSSGFIAAQASVASGQVDVCLVPEAPFNLDKVLDYIYARLAAKGHATVVIAEGAAQEAMRSEVSDAGGALPADTDASGNPVLLDAGRWLKAKIKAAGGAGAKPQPRAGGDGDKPGDSAAAAAAAAAHEARHRDITPDIKYIEPAYMIRSLPAGTVDKVYCRMLSHNAVHGAFAGYSGFTAGVCSQHYVYLPAAEVVRSTRRLDPRGRLFRMMRAALGQPEFS